jgi:nucleoside-diphosphate-sugar epimerase
MTAPDADPVGRLTGVGAAALKAGDQRIIVVGAGGWLGLATLELLHRLLGPQAFAARVVAFGSSARLLELRDGLTVAQRPLSGLADLPSAPSWVLHLAFLTQEKAKAMSEEAYVAANRAISGQVLDALSRIGAEGVFVPSSGAVYMADDPNAEASIRLYGRLKLDDEAAFSAWADARGKRAVIARVFNVSGPYINKQSSYALACFINDALAGRPIEIRATRLTYRSYVAISELMSVVLGALTDGVTGSIRFDTAGDHEYEMSDIAGAVIEALGVKVGILRLDVTQSTPDRYLGKGSIYRRLSRQTLVEPVSFALQIGEVAMFINERRIGCLPSSKS